MNSLTDRAKEIFLDALELAPTDDARAFLDRACGGDAALRGEVEALLAHHARVGTFLASPSPDPSTPPAADRTAAEGPGAAIGPYRLLGEIGEGGMGLVFAAEQAEPVRRLVALKVIKPGMDSRQVVARFEAERQALALMDHPNIATVLDAGTTAGGRPFFVMELVRGVRITDYCDRGRLTVRERLGLFLQVCAAVQHAHQKGVIHRDLKPSNVLVTERDGAAAVKVIDFGVAKAVGQTLTDKTVFTAVAQMVGTPLYMSPEQAGRDSPDVDTRADVYALGVLLYELLTGTTPFDKERFRLAGSDEVRRIIREEEPPRPSARLAASGPAAVTAAADRRTDPRRLTRLCRGDLDWVVMKCLEKDRDRRYETTAALAADVQRYLANEPVQARPPSAGYRVRKFARRNRAALGVAGTVAAAVLVAVGGVGWSVRDAAARRAKADQEAGQFLDRSDQLYRDGKLPEALAEVQKAQGLLNAGGGSVGTRRRAAEWRDQVGAVLRLEELRLQWFNEEDRRRTHADLVRAFRDLGIDVETLPPEEAAARVAASRIGTDLVAALDEWSAAAQFQSWPGADFRRRLRSIARAADPDPWRQAVRRARDEKDVRALRELAAADPARLPSHSLTALGSALSAADDLEGGIAFLRRVQRHHPDDASINQLLSMLLEELRPTPWDEVLGFRRAALAARPSSVRARMNLGVALAGTGRFDDAIVEYQDVLRHGEHYLTLLNLGNALGKKGRHDEAIAVYRRAVRLDPDQGGAHLNIAVTLREQGLLDEAIAEFREAVRRMPDHPGGRNGFGNALRAKGKVDEAIAEYREAVRLKPNTAIYHRNLGDVLDQKRRPGEAAAEYREAARLDPNDAQAHYSLGNMLQQQGHLDDALVACREAVRLQPGDANARVSLGITLRRKGRVDEAVTEYREAVRLEPGHALAHLNLGVALMQQKQADEAIDAYREAIRLKPDSAFAHYNLGNALDTKGMLKESEAALREAIRLQPTMSNAHCNLGFAMSRQGRFDEAEAAYREAIRHQANNAQALGNLAWLLATRPNPKDGDGARAVELATRFGAVAGKQGRYSAVLGAAHYRAGQWEQALAALRTAVETPSAAPAVDARFFLAMTYWQLGDRAAAREWYGRAVAGVPKARAAAADVGRLRAAAAKLLGVPDGLEAAPPPREVK